MRSADAGQDIDAGIVVAPGQFPRQDDVAVQERTHGVGDGVIHVVAFDQDSVEAGDAALRK